MPNTGNYGNQYPNNNLGQSGTNPNAMTVFEQPDTDSRLIKVFSGTNSLAPNLMHGHTRFEYIVPSGNNLAVNFNNPINTQDKSLHWLVLDNSNNSAINKTFVFSPAYVFLDNLGVNTYTVNATKKQVWFGTFTNGKLYLRVASESTN